VGAKDFLEHVVPWDTPEGYITISWHRPETERFFGRSFQSLDAALDFVVHLKEKTEYNIYFCISRQKVGGGRRNKLNALLISCIPMDLDVKPGGYGSIEEAVRCLIEFCDKVGIPRPSIFVSSGGGLHAYWLSRRALPVAEWQPFADAIKRAAHAAGIKFDGQCTGDAARVLRVPDTYNWKYGKPRTVRQLPSTYEKYDFAEALQPILGKNLGPKAVVADAFKHLPLTPSDDVREIPPLKVEPILKECGFLREAYETGGAAFDNSQWNLTVLIATFLEDGNDLAHKFGNQHPTYSFEDTEKKWDVKNKERQANPKIGWPSCKVIEDLGCTHCKTCPHRVKDKSPVNISFEAFLNGSDEDLDELGGSRPPGLRLPEGFCVNEENQICAIIRAKRVGKGIHPPGLLLVMRTIIREPLLQHRDGQHGVGFIANTDRGNTAEVFMSAGEIYSGGIGKHLGQKSVLSNSGAEKMVQLFAESWLDKLMKEDQAVRDPGTMGWRYEDTKRIGFFYGNTLYREDGRESAILATSDSEFRSWYKPTGHREAWLKAAKLLTDRKRPELDIIISIGFAAPLMSFAGTLYGAIINIWGTPGSAKSTAQQVAAAVWGHPKQTRESLNSTAKSIQRRLGLCRNFAAYWDDVQDERHQDALFNTMFVATQGAEGGRLNQDSTMKAKLDWQTLLVACSNASFVEYLIKKQKSTTAGIRRVFEIEFNKQEIGVEPGMIDPVDAGKMFAELERNYGQIGAEYARMLAKNHVAIEQLVSDVSKAFRVKVKGNGDEAYWWGTCGVLLAGAALANQLGAEIDVAAMESFLIEAFKHNRTIRHIEGTEGGTYENTERIMIGFLNHYVGSGNCIYIDKLYEKRGDRIGVLKDPGKDHPIYVQIVRDARKIIFSKRELREYLQKKEIQMRPTVTGMMKHFKVVETRHTLGAGTVYAQGQEYTYELYIPTKQPHPLLEMLTARGPVK
jgi:hypothetical protein